MNNSDKTKPLADADQERFHELYQTHHRRVYSLCLRMTKDISDAEDLTQEVFVQLFRTVGSFRGDSAFTTWLHRLTVNHVLMHLRKNKRRPRSEPLTEKEEMPAQGAVGCKPTNIVDRILLSEVMAKLPDGYCEAVILHDIHGLEHKEIARRKGRTEGTSKSQLHKARVALRALITQPAPAQPVQA
jgi:RNA polymerase sigma-70 factor (ECF subfamily)